MKEKILKKRGLIDILVIVVVACIAGFPLFSSSLDVYRDDGIQHIARAFGTVESLKENLLFPNIIFSYSNGFGYSWNLFYGGLTSISVGIIGLILNNYIVAYKIFVFIMLVLSGYAMYKLVYGMIGNRDGAVLSSILYITFPYHLTDLYTRNALGEFTAFVFIPFVFLGLYNMFYSEEKRDYWLVLGAVGLIFTHNLSTAIVAFFALIYLILHIKKLKFAKIRNSLIINIVAILAISSCYWMPLLETKFSADYQVYEEGAMATTESVAGHGLEITQLFATAKDGSFVFELGPHIIIMVALSVMTLKLLRPEFKKTYLYLLVMGLISLWMSTKYFPWKYLPEVFAIIQFPWRMIMMSAFLLSVVSAINMYALIKKFSYKDVIIISAISIVYIAAFYNLQVNFTDDISQINEYDLGVFSGKNDEITVGAARGEYLPTNAFNNRFYIATREDNIYVLSGKSVITNENKNLSNYTASLQTFDSEYTVFELPYIYYPGYEVTLDGIVIDNFETENGFVGFVMGENDEADLEVNYKGTAIMKFSLSISLLSVILIILLNVRKNLKHLKNKEK